MFGTITTAALLIALTLIIFGLCYRGISGRCSCLNRLDGKTVIITGASAGIGETTAFDLAARGARLILACRNQVKAQKVAGEIILATGNKDVWVRELDTSDLISVRKFANDILLEEKALHVLINNAGVTLSSMQRSKQGFELTHATNHLGHFLLTNMLLDLLKKSAPSRIITVSSMAHKMGKFDISDLNFDQRKYGAITSYAQSKLCNVLFTKELAHKLKDTEVTANCLHPGAVYTEFGKKENTWIGYFLGIIGFFSFKSSELGAQTTIHLSVSDEGKNTTGEYFSDCKIAKASATANDPGTAKKLWEISEDTVDLQKSERHY